MYSKRSLRQKAKLRIIQADLTRDDDLHSLVQTCGLGRFSRQQCRLGQARVRCCARAWTDCGSNIPRQPARADDPRQRVFAGDDQERRGRGRQYRLGVGQKRRSRWRHLLSLEVRPDRLYSIALSKKSESMASKSRLSCRGFVDTPMIPPVKHLDRSKMIQADRHRSSSALCAQRAGNGLPRRDYN